METLFKCLFAAQIRRKIWSHLLKKSLMENFSAVVKPLTGFHASFVFLFSEAAFLRCFAKMFLWKMMQILQGSIFTGVLFYYACFRLSFLLKCLYQRCVSVNFLTFFRTAFHQNTPELMFWIDAFAMLLQKYKFRTYHLDPIKSFLVTKSAVATWKCKMIFLQRIGFETERNFEELRKVRWKT